MRFAADQAWRMVSVCRNNISNCKNQALTNGFNQIPDFVDHHRWYAKSLFQHLCSRKAQNEPYGNNKKQQRDFWNRILTLEVLQKSVFAFPCSVGSKNKYCFPPIMGTRKLTFSTPLQPESQRFHFSENYQWNLMIF